MTTSRTPDLVGRDAELQELCSRLGIGLPAAEPPLTTALLLAGDAGVGKTRLLTELRDRAVQAGWQVVAGHCLDLSDSALPFLPFSEILGRLTAATPETATAVLDEQPVLRRLQPGRRVRSREGAGDDNPAERADLFEGMQELLARVARTDPLLVVVEDAHWADQSTRDLLGFLFARPLPGVALVVSYRSDDLHRRHPLRRQVAEWARLRVDRVQLEPLDEAAVRRLVHVLHPDPIAERSVEAIVARAEGNAFFVEELVGAAWDTGGVPGDLADVLLVRLDRLDETTQQVVRLASVAGRRVGHDLLAAVSGMDAATLDAALRTAVEQHVLTADRIGTYQFRHALLAEAVYDDLLPGERVRVHGAYARALASGEVGGTSAELARHARLGQDLATALGASVDAGDEARRVGGPQEASQHYEQALELLDHPALDASALVVGRVDLVLRTSAALTSAGLADRATALLRATLDGLPAEATPLDRGRLCRSLALSLLMTDIEDDEVELAEEGVRLLAGAGDEEHARALGTYARVLANEGREDEAREAATEALSLSQSLDLPRLSTDIMATLAAIGLRRHGDEVGEAFHAVLERARATGAVQTELRALYGLGRHHQDRGDFDVALTHLDRCRDLGVERGLHWAPYVFDALAMANQVRWLTGRWDQLLECATSQTDWPSEVLRGIIRSMELQVLAARGAAGAPSLAAQLRPRWHDDAFLTVFSAGAELELAEQRADAPGALALYERGVAAVTVYWREYFQARLRLATQTLGVLGTAAREQTAAERLAAAKPAQQLVEDGHAVIDEHRQQRLVHGPESLAWIERLEAEHLRWRWLAQVEPPGADDLVRAWERTVDAFESYGHVYETARARARLAEVLRGTGNLERARTEAGTARVSARSLGATPLLGELDAVVPDRAPRREATPASTQEPASTVALTPREAEVLALVAEGRTNGQIGAQLFIATKTVSVHVSNVLAKLGASSRTEAAAVARRRGLIE